MTNDYKSIAQEFMKRWESAWNAGDVGELMELYTEESILVGYVTAVGKRAVEELLKGILDQGWKRIEIRITQIREINGIILVANEYSAFGAGVNEGKKLEAKSSHVLALINGSYVSVLHTAT